MSDLRRHGRTLLTWLRQAYKGMPPRRRMATVAAGSLLLLALVGGVAGAVLAGRDAAPDESGTARAPTATAGAPRATATAARTPLATPARDPTPAPTAASAGLLSSEPVASTGTLTAGDLTDHGSGPTARGAFTGQQLIISTIGVDAPLTIKTVGADGRMPNPNGPEDVAWYDFGSFAGVGGVPGKGGNSVFSGHVDYRNYGPAVFWRLRELQAGDLIQVLTAEGTITYEVRWNRTADANTAPWNQIVASTATESLTLITCAGQFDPNLRQYDQRQIVWAVRVS